MSLDTVKPTSLKLVLGFQEASRNCLVHLLTGTPMFIGNTPNTLEEVEFNFLETEAYRTSTQA